MKSISWLSLTWNQFEAKLKPHTVMMTMDSLSVIKSLLTTEIGHRVIRQELPGVTLALLAINTIPSKKQEDPTVSLQDSNTDIKISEDRVKKKRHFSARYNRAIWLGTISKWSC